MMSSAIFGSINSIALPFYVFRPGLSKPVPREVLAKVVGRLQPRPHHRRDSRRTARPALRPGGGRRRLATSHQKAFCRCDTSHDLASSESGG
jgi:hypothetical protein